MSLDFKVSVMSKLPPLKNIKSLTYQDDFLSILFNVEWYQEDISVLQGLILLPLTGHKIQETNIGADREDIRFIWNENYFVLNFDCYSQSCWIEAQDDSSKSYLLALHTTMTKY